MKPRDFFASRPVFTYAEFVSALDTKGRSERTHDALLAYYTKTERVLRVRRGLYVSVPPTVSREECPVDPYLVAAKLTDDAVWPTTLLWSSTARLARCANSSPT